MRTLRSGAACRGFTLIELLVVIAIIGVLVGLLLPAVQQAREAARRSQCSNNLKQLSLGIHNYHSANKKFPLAFWAPDAFKNGIGDTGYGQGISWVAKILPYIEQEPLHSQIDFDIAGITSSTDPNNSLSVSNPLAELFCASNPSQTDRRAATSTVAHQGASWATHGMHYYGIMGVVVPNAANANYSGYGYHNGGTWPFAVRSTQGIFSARSSNPAVSRQPDGTSMKDVTDGVSKTYLLGEISWDKMCTQGSFNVKSYLVGYGGWGAGQFYNSVRNIWYSRPINTSKLQIQTAAIATNDTYNNLNWGSNHPGGCHFSMGDGSVRFVNETISMDLFMAAGSRNSGEP